MKIFLLLNPPTVTAQESKVALVKNKPVFYKPKKVKQARLTLIEYLKPFRLTVQIEGPVRLDVIWRFPKGKSHKHNEWRITKPDTDNLEKMLKDCMTEVGFWKDDAQVVVEHVEKVWSGDPTGIAIEIKVLDKIKETA
jgi:crossover junction endodeoxyribonuclease RusA